jgi:polysaccharide export outer membrane protein
MNFKNAALLLVLLVAAASCVSKKKIIYLQGSAGGANASISNYEPIIQPDDILYVTVSSQNPEAATPFTLRSEIPETGQVDLRTASYLVDKDGYIEFPVLGKLKAGGLTRSEFLDMLHNKLQPYVSDAVLNLTILNYKVTVLGEVARPGPVPVSGNRVTVLEAIAAAGDLTLYGKRQNILVVRDNQGEKTFARLDLARADIVNSPYYYLRQNDVVYVEPRNAKVDSTVFGSNVTTITSLISFALTTTLILLRVL